MDKGKEFPTQNQDYSRLHFKRYVHYLQIFSTVASRYRTSSDYAFCGRLLAQWIRTECPTKLIS